MGGSHLDSTRLNQSCLTLLSASQIPLKSDWAGGSRTPKGRATRLEFA